MSLLHRSGVHLRRLQVLGAISCLAALILCNCHEHPKKEGQIMSQESPCDFTNVSFASRSNPCSPEVADDFRGIRIASPPQVLLTDEPRLPVCGTLQVAASFASKFRYFTNEIVVVAVDAKTHQPYSCNLLKPGYRPLPGGGLKPSTEGYDRATVKTWFNVNLFDRIEELPRSPGRYFVYAHLGEAKSNVVTVDVLRP